MKVKAEGCNISSYWQNLFCFVVLDGNEKFSKINCCNHSILSLTLFLTPPSFNFTCQSQVTSCDITKWRACLPATFHFITIVEELISV